MSPNSKAVHDIGSSQSRSFSESRATPSRAVYSELSDAHASITGRRPDKWPILTPGWAKDQPVSPSNPYSTPLECVARVESSGGRALQFDPIAPLPTSTIPETVNPQLDNSRRRSRSLGGLDDASCLHNGANSTGLTQHNTISDIYQSYGHQRSTYETRLSQETSSSHVSGRETGLYLEQATPVQSSVARSRGPELSPKDSFESFQAYLEAAPSEASNFSPASEQPYGETNAQENLFRPGGRSSTKYNEGVQEGHARSLSYGSSSSISYATYHLHQYGYPVGGEQNTALPSHYQSGGEVPRMRSGTPPLLFGAHALGQADQATPLRSRGANSDHDWETVEGAQVHGTVSSRADVSSSSSGMKNRGLPPGGQVLRQPPHPRYAQSWNMLRDEHTGHTVMLPDNPGGVGRMLDAGIATPPLMTRRLGSDYHHPSPLSQGQAERFNFSPLLSEPQLDSAGTEAVQLPPRRRPPMHPDILPRDAVAALANSQDQLSFSGDDSSVLEMALKSKQISKYDEDQSHRKEQSSAWVSTDEDNDHDAFVDQRDRQISLTKMVGTKQKGNVTGTPQGTGAREVGSSLANASSPNEGVVSSSPYMESSPFSVASEVQDQKKIFHRRIIDGSLNTIQTMSSDAIFERVHRVSSSHYSTDTHDHGLTALPAIRSKLPQEFLDHKKDLIANGWLPLTAEKRRSGPMAVFAPIKNATASTGAAVSRQLQRLPYMTGLAQLRQRSPQRSAIADENLVKESTLPIFNPSFDIMKTPGVNKDARKRKVSDGEEAVNNTANQKLDSPNAHLLPMMSNGQYTSATTSVEPVEFEGITIHPTTTAHIGDRDHHLKPSKRAAPATTIGASDHENKTTTAQENAAFNSYFGSAQHLQKLQDKVSSEYKELYQGAAAAKVLKSKGPIKRSEPPVKADRTHWPVARIEEPRLHRRPGIDEWKERREYQKYISRIVLVGCLLFPPLLLLYGCGYMDKIMVWASKGDTAELDPMYKVAAFCLASAFIVLLVSALVVGLFIAAH